MRGKPRTSQSTNPERPRPGVSSHGVRGMGHAGAPEAEAAGHSRVPSFSGHPRAIFSPRRLWGKKALVFTRSWVHIKENAAGPQRFPHVFHLLLSSWVVEVETRTFSHCLNMRLKYSIRRRCKILLRKSEFLIVL